MTRLPEHLTGHGPAVLLVHGWGGFKEGWGPLADALAAAGFRTVAVDLPGWGAAPAPPRFAHRPRDYAAALAGTIHAHRPVAAVGHSLGGAPALLAAREHRLEGLVAIAPQWSPAPRRSLASWRGLSRVPVIGPTLVRLGLARARRNRDAVRDAFLAAIARPEAEITDPRLHDLLEQATDRFMRTDTRTLARSIAPLLDADIRPLARGLASDTLVVLGARDPVIDVGAARWAIASAARARTIVVDGAGHFPHFEAPEQAVPAIIDHLAAVAARG